jgi:hypothetical protein
LESKEEILKVFREFSFKICKFLKAFDVSRENQYGNYIQVYGTESETRASAFEFRYYKGYLIS